MQIRVADVPFFVMATVILRCHIPAVSQTVTGERWCDVLTLTSNVRVEVLEIAMSTMFVTVHGGG